VSDRIVSHWAASFGLPAAAFDRPGFHVVPHGSLAGWHGVWAFRRGETWVVSAPPERVADLRAKPVDPTSLHDRECLRAWLGAPEATVIGPAWWGRLPHAGLAERPPGEVRRLEARDRDALRTFRADVGEEDWATGGVEADAMAVFGAYARGQLAAIAGCRVRGDVADPCLLTLPRYRARGSATAAAWGACRFLLEEDRLLLYQTLAANEPAVRVALRVGFRHDASHMAVRLP